MLWLVSYCVYIRLYIANTVVMSCFPVLFYKRNVRPCVYIITWCKRSREFGQIWKYMYLCRPSSAAWVHINFQILPNSFSRISGHFLLLKYLQWLWVIVADQFRFYICLIKALNKQTNYSADVWGKCVCGGGVVTPGPTLLALLCAIFLLIINSYMKRGVVERMGKCHVMWIVKVCWVELRMHLYCEGV